MAKHKSGSPYYIFYTIICIIFCTIIIITYDATTNIFIINNCYARQYEKSIAELYHKKNIIDNISIRHALSGVSSFSNIYFQKNIIYHNSLRYSNIIKYLFHNTQILTENSLKTKTYNPNDKKIMPFKQFMFTSHHTIGAFTIGKTYPISDRLNIHFAEPQLMDIYQILTNYNIKNNSDYIAIDYLANGTSRLWNSGDIITAHYLSPLINQYIRIGIGIIKNAISPHDHFYKTYWKSQQKPFIGQLATKYAQHISHGIDITLSTTIDAPLCKSQNININQSFLLKNNGKHFYMMFSTKKGLNAHGIGAGYQIAHVKLQTKYITLRQNIDSKMQELSEYYLQNYTSNSTKNFHTIKKRNLSRFSILCGYTIHQKQTKNQNIEKNTLYIEYAAINSPKEKNMHNQILSIGMDFTL